MSSARALLITLALGAATATALAAEPPPFNGTWVGVVNLQNGMKLPFIAHLKQQDNSVSGVLDGINGGPDVMIQDGNISGDALTFTGTRTINKQNVTFKYTVTQTGKGGLDFKIARADGQGQPLEAMTRRLSAMD